MMTVDWNAVSALAGLGAALVAIGALWAESRRSRFTQSIDLILRFEDRFVGSEMRRARALAARGLRTGDATETDDVLDFFETLGLLVERGALDLELVWSSFDYWLRHYGALTARYVADERAKDDAVWRSFVRLRDNAAERDGRETAENERLSKAEIDEFLKYEEGQEKGEVRDADLN